MIAPFVALDHDKLAMAVTADKADAGFVDIKVISAQHATADAAKCRMDARRWVFQCGTH
jgi:hypothetical protein